MRHVHLFVTLAITFCPVVAFAQDTPASSDPADPVAEAYGQAITKADAAFHETVAHAREERRRARERADERFNGRIDDAIKAWRRTQQDANAAAIAEFTRRIERARRKGDLVGAQAIEQQQQAFSEASVGQTQAFDLAAAGLAPTPDGEAPEVADDGLFIEARVFGESALHVTNDGLYWENVSQHTKPRASIDGRPWELKWRNGATQKGPDTAAPLPMAFDPQRTTVELVYASTTQGGAGPRQPKAIVTTRVFADEIVVSIADHAPTPGWYGLRVRGAVKPQPQEPAAPQPVAVTLLVFDDDTNAQPTVFLNGTAVENADHVTPYLSRFPLRLSPGDRLVLTAQDSKTGSVAFLLVSDTRRLLAWSRPGLPTSTSPNAAAEAESGDGDWQPAVAVPKNLAPLQGAEGAPPSLPENLTGIWTPATTTGRCNILVWPQS